MEANTEVESMKLSNLMEQVKKLAGDVELGIEGAQYKLYEKLDDLERRILFIEQSVTGECDE